MIPASPHIRKHYDVVGIEPGIVSTGIGTFDLRTISRKDADRLFKLGVPYLRLKKKEENPSPKASAKAKAPVADAKSEEVEK